MNISRTIIGFILFLTLCSSFFYSIEAKSAVKGKMQTIKRTNDNLRDLEFTQKLKYAIAKDKSLSEKARNIKIITVRKNLTLSGKVASREEKNKISNITKLLAKEKTIYNVLSY